MSRSIKFRAWEGGKMFTPSDIEYSTDGTVLVDDRPVGDREGEVRLLQCTGLKDKNGSEIYDGDILQKYDFGLDFLETIAISGAMRKLAGSIGSVQILVNYVAGPVDAKYCAGFEIIGNIDETPNFWRLGHELRP